MHQQSRSIEMCRRIFEAPDQAVNLLRHLAPFRRAWLRVLRDSLDCQTTQGRHTIKNHHIVLIRIWQLDQAFNV
jgi:hypothetical protein